MNNEESRIQQSMVQWLDLVLPKECRYFAIPNGGNRNAITGAILKREGVKAGISDLCFLHNGRTAFVEVKAPGGRLQESQVKFLDWLVANGFEAAVCRSKGDLHTFLTEWGVKLKGE